MDGKSNTNFMETENNSARDISQLIFFGEYKPMLTAEIFSCLQVINDLSKNYCIYTRPNECKIIYYVP